MIPDGITWVDHPPIPSAYCPRCGEKTVIERDPPTSICGTSICGTIRRTPTQEELDKAKQREIEYYRKKYWGGENDGKADTGQNEN